jgi:hypothetical protein
VVAPDEKPMAAMARLEKATKLIAEDALAEKQAMTR